MLKSDLTVLRRYGVTEERMPWALFELGRGRSNQLLVSRWLRSASSHKPGRAPVAHGGGALHQEKTMNIPDTKAVDKTMAVTLRCRDIDFSGVTRAQAVDYIKSQCVDMPDAQVDVLTSSLLFRARRRSIRFELLDCREIDR